VQSSGAIEVRANRTTTAGTAATVAVASAVLLLLGSAVVLTWVALAFSPDDPARLLAVAHKLFPWRPLSYIRDPRNIRKLLSGVTFAYPFAWAAALLAAILYRSLRDLVERIFDDLNGLSLSLREELSTIRLLLVSDKWTSATLAIILASGSALRLYYVSTDMNADELWQFFSSSYNGPLVTAAVGTPWHAYSNHLMYVGWKIFGLNHWGIRAHSITAGCLLIALTFIWATYFFNRYIALIAAGMVSGSLVLITYSVYARNYVHIPLLGMLTLLLVHRGLWYGRRGYVYIAALVTALGLYGLPSMAVFFLVAMAMLGVHFARTAGSQHRAPWRVYLAYPVITVTLVTLLYVPYFVVGGYREVMALMTEQHVSFRVSAFASQLVALCGQMLPEWGNTSVAAVLIIAGISVSVLQEWRGKTVLVTGLLATAFVAWAGQGFQVVRLYSYLVPFFGTAVAVLLVQGWRAAWRAWGRVPRGTPAFARTASLVILAIGLAYSGNPENAFGTRTEERLFGFRRDTRLIMQNAQGVEQMVTYLRDTDRLRPGVLVDSLNFTFRYPILFALLEKGYSENEHFNVWWGNFRHPQAIYMVYENIDRFGKKVEPPDHFQYDNGSWRRGAVLMVFERTKLVEFSPESEYVAQRPVPTSPGR
jgi:hypothetical protein